MATPSKPVRHGRTKPATGPDTSAGASSGTSATQPNTGAGASSGTSATQPNTGAGTPAGATPLVIRVVFEPVTTIASVDVALVQDDPDNNLHSEVTLTFRSGDGPQERVVTLARANPTLVGYRYSLRAVRTDGTAMAGTWVADSDSLVKIDAAALSALR